MVREAGPVGGNDRVERRREQERVCELCHRKLLAQRSCGEQEGEEEVQ